MKRISIVLIVGLFLVGCKKDKPDTPTNPTPTPTAPSPAAKTYSGDFMHDYFTLQCDIVRTTPGFLPTSAARSYGYLGVASYEATVHGIPGALSLAGQLQGFSAGSLPVPDLTLKYNWALAANAACAQIMRHMFDANITVDNLLAIDQMEEANKVSLGATETNEVIARSEQFGIELANAIYEISITDGGHEAYTDPFSLSNPIVIPPDPYCWVPTGPQPGPLTPYWGENRSFISGIVASSQPETHIPFSAETSSEFYGQAMDVYTQVTALNTPDQVTIAEYWADDPFQTCTPAGHTFNILKQLLSESNATLEKTAVAFGMMGVAENDAFISCWKTKYETVLIRPVSYIQQYIDPAFTTIIGTPPFPAYVSGHSSEIGAGVKILTHLFANANGDYTFTDLSQIQYGFSARTYNNFFDMADECAMSRYYGGIHFEMDNSKGLDLGFAVGEAVLNQLSWPQNIE